MTPLNFRIYEQLAKQKGIEKNLDCITFLTDFDKDKLTLKRNEINVQNYDILYNGKPFRIAPKAFSGIVKRSKCFKREKKVKIKDPVVSMQLWHVSHHRRTGKIRSAKKEKFCWFLESYYTSINCDERLAPKHLYYFEDGIIAFDQVINTDKDCLICSKLKCSREYRITSELISCSALIPSRSKFELNELKRWPIDY